MLDMNTLPWWISAVAALMAVPVYIMCGIHDKHLLTRIIWGVLSVVMAIWAVHSIVTIAVLVLSKAKEII